MYVRAKNGHFSHRAACSNKLSNLVPKCQTVENKFLLDMYFTLKPPVLKCKTLPDIAYKAPCLLQSMQKAYKCT